MVAVDHSPTPANPPQAEFVALPARGGDPVCGLSRSWWYATERAGRIQLVRLKQPGNIRGRVLLPVRKAVALIYSMDCTRQPSEAA